MLVTVAAHAQTSLVLSTREPRPKRTAPAQGNQTPPGLSKLAQAAAAMQPGTWAPLATNNFNHGGIVRPPDGGSGLEFNQRAQWNPVNRTVMILGGSHPGTGTTCNSTFLAGYTEATNTWARNLQSPCPSFDDATGIGSTNLVHPYDHQAIDSNGNLYHRQYTSGKVMMFSQAAQAWSQCSPYNTNGFATNSWPNFGEFQAAGSLVYFPDRNALYFLDGDWGLWELPLASGCNGKWTLLASANGGGFTPRLAGLGSYHNIGQYSALCRCVIIGGNSNQMYKIDVKDTITKLAPSPMFLGIPQNPGMPVGAIYTVDPVSGHFLVWSGNGNDNGKAYDFDPVTDSWKTTGIASPIFPGPEGGVTETVAVPIPQYGVIMFVQAGSSSGSSIYLYKHGNVKSAPSSTSTPSPLQASASSQAAAPTPALNLGSGKANGWSSRTAGVNLPSGASSVVGFQGFDTFPAVTRQQYFKFYDRASITTDCAIAADGCSLKFAILRGYQQGEPGWFDWNFSSNLSKTFGQGQEFYVQYRERLDPGMLHGSNFPKGEGFKHDIITEGDTPTKVAGDCSNSPGELVLVQDGNGAAYPGLYHNCGFSGGPLAFMQRGYQLVQLGGIAGTNFLDQNIGGCPHYSGRGIPVTDPTCFSYVANEWFTVQIHVKVGTFGQPNSILEVWLAHEGKPAELVINAADAALVNDGSGGASGRYGKIQLSAYNTAMTGSVVDTAVWFDDLMVSTRRIPDPDVATPNAPDSLSLSHITPGNVTVNWRVNSQNGTPQDDTGFLVERCTGDGAVCFPNPQKQFTQIGEAPAGANFFVDKTVARHATYTYRVRAQNKAGKSGYAAAQCFNQGPGCGGTAAVP